ncbi:MAG: hypothetical protein AAGE94_07990 [Acidobacteriota bacterium]
MPRLSLKTFLVLLTLMMATVSFAAEAPDARLAMAADHVSWSVGAEVGHASLTVIGPEGYAKRVAFEGETPIWSVDGPDGRYQWELRYRAPIDGTATGEVPSVAWARVVSGSFEVRHGAMVLADPERGAGSRVPTKTNSITQGSACIGTSCDSHESFGEDTLRLDEENLRLHFDDTSTSAPNNDWRILINEVDAAIDNSAFFGIEDSTGAEIPVRIDAGAATDALRVSSGGLGLGTATPMADLHIVSGDTPALRLDQDTSSGQMAQVWALEGDEDFFVVRDVTEATSPFKVGANAPDDSLVIDGDGEVGVGTSAPTAPLHARRDGGGSNEEILLVENTATTTSSRVLAKLKNQGQLNVVFERTDGTSGTWIFAHNGSTFAISKSGTGANELQVESDGDLVIRGSLKANSGADVFPDYVFEDGYSLRSLDEVAAFIDEHGHLPNVMSRDDVRREGTVDMTRLQLQMLEKIEELMLYTLEQQRTIERLEARDSACSAASQVVP